MAATHSVTRSFSSGRGTPSFTFVFKWLGNTRLQTRFQMLGTPPVTHSFSNCCYTPRCTLVFNGRFTPSYTLVFKLLIHTWLHTQIQMVGKHARVYLLAFKRPWHIRLYAPFICSRHPVTPSFSNGRVKPSYILVFKLSAHNVTHSF